jgi:hypothetical protein
VVLSNLNSMVINPLSGTNFVLAMADRTGSGFARAWDHQPATVLSPGHLPLPRLPEPEPQVRSRQAVPDAKAKSVTAAGTPTGPVGSTPGATAAARPIGRAARPGYPRWRLATSPATAAK